MAKEYDLVILGGGPGGYVAAIRASQLGLKTAIVEKQKLGGTCLHQGCIPTKALLRSAEIFQQTKNSLKWGVLTSNVSINFSLVQNRKDGIVENLYNGILHLVKKGKIDVYDGIGRILGPSIFSPMSGTISVEMNSGAENEMLIPKNVIIATGSSPSPLQGLPFDHSFILSSDDALQLKELPKSLLIIGGGVIGIEWASMMVDFGVEVTVVESAKEILPYEDQDISREMKRLLKKKNVRILTNTKIFPDSKKIEKTGVSITAEIDGKEQILKAEKVLVSIGRQANIKDIGLENTDILVENGYLKTNPYYQTKEAHIYAIGDCIGGLQLAHVASREGIIAVEHLANLTPSLLDYKAVSKCVYSSPEVASVGMTEKEAKEKGLQVKIGKFSFKGIGKALVLGDMDGFVKIITDENTQDLLGVHMIGPHVTDLISEAGLAKVLDATPWEISQVIHPHPSLSEVIGEAALAVEGNALHS